MSNVIHFNFRRSAATNRVIASLKRLERAMDANAAMTDALIDRAELLEKLSAAMARDYERTSKGKRGE